MRVGAVTTMSACMEPMVGRIVHYVPRATHDGQPACRAAIITETVNEQVVHLAVFVPHHGLLSEHACVHEEEEHRGGTWHWPESVLHREG